MNDRLDIKALATIQEISETLSSVHDLHRFFYFTVCKVANIVDVMRCSIVRLVPRQSLGYVIASHDAPHLFDLPIDLHKYPEINALQKSGQPVVINDVVRSRLLAPCRECLRKTPYTAIMAVPILSVGHPTGALLLRSSGRASGFSETELQFCQTVASLASLSPHYLATARGTPKGGRESATRPDICWEDFVGVSPKIQAIRDIIERLSDISEPVLIHGESGVGKENVAQALHTYSTRSYKPMVKINCAALPVDLLESEFFGYERGAFTGAYRQKPGKFELANGGTIFLDEIGDLHSLLQAKLLQVLQEGRFARLGGTSDTTVDVRVVAATNKDLEAEVASGNFRQDLYYRLNVVNIWVPPLRQRRQDIPLLVDHFLKLYNEKYNRRVNRVSDQLITLFQQYDWPGNVRELENTMRRIVVLEEEPSLIAEFQSRIGETASVAGDEKTSLSLKEIARRAALRAEYEAMHRILEQTRWNRRKAAQKLGVSYRTLQYKMKACGLGGGGDHL